MSGSAARAWNRSRNDPAARLFAVRPIFDSRADGMNPPLAAWAAGLLGGFLAGSLPTGYLLVKIFKGVDVRQYGSGNSGATNVFRVAGKIPAILTLATDILKGLVPVLSALHVYPGMFAFAACAGLAAICGHAWSPFLNFRGGKGGRGGWERLLFSCKCPRPSRSSFRSRIWSLSGWSGPRCW